MKIVNHRIFEGRNIYSYKKCIRFELDLEGYSEVPSVSIKNFNKRLLEAIPELYDHECGICEKGGFVKRLEEGTYLAHIFEHIIIAIQNRLGIDVSYGKAREISGERYYCIIQYEYKKTVLEIAKQAVSFINALCMGCSFDLDKSLVNAGKLLKDEAMGPSTKAIVDAAKKYGIPVMNMWDSGFYMLGYGKYSKRIESTVVDGTDCTSADIASDKILTKKILSGQCLPVAPGGVVSTFLEALIQAEAIGYPVVLKPRYGNHGTGVKLNLRNAREMMKAFNDLKSSCNDIMIEKYYKGRDFRICMIGGEMAAASLRLPPFVKGDGVRKISDLIKEVNTDPKRGEDHEKPLTIIKIDEELKNTLKKQNLEITTVLPKGRLVYLRENANISTGGVAIDCTADVCQENIEIFKRAAKAMNLNICGIDVCHDDLGKPIEGKGIIMEVNAGPGIRMHGYPYKGKERDVGDAIVKMMFDNMPKYIPIAAVTGTNGKTTTTRMIAHTLSLIGYKVGMTTTGGIYIDGRCIHRGDDTGYKSAETVLTNREVEVAVLETARGGIVRNGLRYDLADVGVITNITEDHLGIDGIETIKDLAMVKSLVIESVKPDGYCVINGDDPISVDIMDRASGNLIIFSKDKENKYMRDNIRKGGYGVYINNGAIYAERCRKIWYVADIADIPVTLNGVLDYNVENSLAACSGLIGLGINYCSIAEGLKSFNGDTEGNPGRFNIFDINGGKVILDYGHNIEGYKAVIRGLRKIPHKRAIGVIGVPGDRLDSNVMKVGKISGDYFDYIVVKEDKDKRGRAPGEIAAIINKGIGKSSLKENSVSIILDEREALSAAIDMMDEGDMVVMFFESFDDALDIVKHYEKNDEIKVHHKLG